MKEKATPRVLIVGAGPTGLMLACQLALHDVAFRLIDKNEDHTTQSRALVVQARSIEIFGQMDLAQEALQLGEKAKAVNVVVNGKRTLHMNIRDIGEGLTLYPYLLMLEQSKTEKLLNDFLAHRGHTVERQTALLDVTQDAHVVTATIKHPDGQEEVLQVDWLIGADGAHSVVRHKLNIPFVGKTYQQSLFVLDCEVSLHFPSDEMEIAFAERAFAGFFPLTNGRCRVIGTVPEACEGKDAVSFEEVAQDFAQRLNMDVNLHNPEWISLYHSHHRAVATFQKDRCFLAGDAAHIHSPVGAQGMNTGLQDAYNLAWKLTLVIKKQAKTALLDSYEQERLPVARALLHGTDRAFRIIVSDSWIPGLLRTRVLSRLAAFAANRNAVQRLAFRTVSQTGVRYRKSSLSKSLNGLPENAPHAGDRFPWLRLKFTADGAVEDLFQKLCDTHFSLILVGQSNFTGETPELNGLLHTYVVPADPTNDEELARTRIPQPSFYLIRPDGYVGLCGASIESADIQDYFTENLHLLIQRA